jgi:hypothetical protein
MEHLEDLLSKFKDSFRTYREFESNSWFLTLEVLYLTTLIK